MIFKWCLFYLVDFLSMVEVQSDQILKKIANFAVRFNPINYSILN